MVGSKSVAMDLRVDFDYISVSHRHLDIPVKEAHDNRSEDQPPEFVDRYWTRGVKKPKRGAT